MIKVLIVDDSLTAIDMLSSILTTASDIEVIGKVLNGREAINFITNNRVKPDVICTDISMPVMNGFEMIEYIMDKFPMPILVVTFHDKDKNFMKALELGALDLIQKPAPELWQELPKMGMELIEKVRLLSKVKVIRHISVNDHSITKNDFSSGNNAFGNNQVDNIGSIICIASSTGGPNALFKLLTLLPKDFQIPILIVQHMTDSFFISNMAEWFSQSTALKVTLAENGMQIMPGTIYISIPKKHLIVNGTRMFLEDSPHIKLQKPSADLLFESAAKSYGKNVIGIVLTGIGDDGSDGVRAISRKGGRVFAQNEESSLVFGMPKSAIATNCVEKVLSLEGIAEELIRITL